MRFPKTGELLLSFGRIVILFYLKVFLQSSRHKISRHEDGLIIQLVFDQSLEIKHVIGNRIALRDDLVPQLVCLARISAQEKRRAKIGEIVLSSGLHHGPA
jgi:hypothetical protein